jgi:hypothetical protein
MLTRHCAPIILKFCFADFFSCSDRHSYWRRVYRCANSIGGVKEDDRVRCASPIFKPIAYKLSFTNRKRKYFAEQMTATLKIKQTSIATVRNHILSVACFLTPLFFHYPLPLKYLKGPKHDQVECGFFLHKSDPYG